MCKLGPGAPFLEATSSLGLRLNNNTTSEEAFNEDLELAQNTVNNSYDCGGNSYQQEQGPLGELKLLTLYSSIPLKLYNMYKKQINQS